MNLTVASLLPHFGLDGRVLAVAPHGTGHINDTFLVTCEVGGAPTRVILQHLNEQVFQNIPALMENLVRVTDHQHRKLAAAGLPEPDRRALTVIRTTTGASWWRADDGRVWRCFRYIGGARSYDQVETPAQAQAAARAFARFQRQLVDLPGGRLHETLPLFHHTPARFEALCAAIAADPCNRACAVREEIGFFAAREAEYRVVVDGLRDGSLPERVTHNDTKLNNVLIDDATGEGICVIDLDTVMPGSLLYDFGDLVRSATNAAAEDTLDLASVRMDFRLFAALTEGFLAEAGAVMTPAEVALLAFSGKLITAEIGMRFLTDHLLGDTYFKVSRLAHNRDRCRTQIALARSIESQLSAMERCVAAAVAAAGSQPLAPAGP